jgi:hypothetical protein
LVINKNYTEMHGQRNIKRVHCQTQIAQHLYALLSFCQYTVLLQYYTVQCTYYCHSVNTQCCYNTVQYSVRITVIPSIHSVVTILCSTVYILLSFRQYTALLQYYTVQCTYYCHSVNAQCCYNTVHFSVRITVIPSIHGVVTIQYNTVQYR